MRGISCDSFSTLELKTKTTTTATTIEKENNKTTDPNEEELETTTSSERIETPTTYKEEKHQAPLPHDIIIENLILNSNSSQYTWVGNHFLPPLGIPQFTPQQIKDYFGTRNVLVIGDSTSRRFYNSLFAMISATDMSNISEEEMNSPHIIDFNNEKVQTCKKEQDRFITKMPYRNMGNMCRDNIATTTTTTNTKFDFMYGFCYRDIAWLWRDIDEPKENFPNSQLEHGGIIIEPSVELEQVMQGQEQSEIMSTELNDNLQGLQKEYDLIILALGIWELSQPFTCGSSISENAESNPTILLSNLHQMLKNIQNNNPHSKLQIVIRTTSFDQEKKGSDQVLHDSIRVTKEFIQSSNTNTNSNITLVDWGTVINKRSYGNERIEGDTPRHYNLEARLLLIQQLMHELTKSKLLLEDR